MNSGELRLFNIYCHEQDQIRKNWVGRKIKDHPAFLPVRKRIPIFDQLSETELTKLRETRANLKNLRIRVSTRHCPASTKNFR